MANKTHTPLHPRTATKPKEKSFNMPFSTEVEIFDEARSIYTKRAIFQDGHATSITTITTATTTIKSGLVLVKPADMTPFHKGYDAFIRQQEQKPLSAQTHKKRITKAKAFAPPDTTSPSQGSSLTGTPSLKPIVPTAKKGVFRVIKPRRGRMDLAERLWSGKAAFCR
ncbi:hypothetical protein N7474_001649 [Penicillium riverlandense]|uniref:uncharacterized protein n=1 Tax=Penicillium riverlandense TaxID=1903569 RepID=UPI0025476D65|nr:uncharacterized protein N7474_001649 [Penicillium riverlandense]KAJ5833338.1 hypothetical protein N7474_001649 [Penicillium riverlandense]